MANQKDVLKGENTMTPSVVILERITRFRLASNVEETQTSEIQRWAEENNYVLEDIQDVGDKLVLAIVTKEISTPVVELRPLQPIDVLSIMDELEITYDDEPIDRWWKLRAKLAEQKYAQQCDHIKKKGD